MEIRELKGLLTNIDEMDANPEYFKRFENFEVRNGYAMTSFYELDPQTLPDDITILKYTTLQINDDPLANKLEDDIYVSNYTFNIINIEFIVGYANNKYVFYYKTTASWVELPTEDIDSIVTADEHPVFIENVNGVAKIFLYHDTLWFGRIDRLHKNLTGTYAYYIDRLVEPFDYNNMGTTIENGVLKCKDGRRAGAAYEIEITTDDFTENKTCTFIFESKKTPQNYDPDTFTLNTYNVYDKKDLEFIERISLLFIYQGGVAYLIDSNGVLQGDKGLTDKGYILEDYDGSNISEADLITYSNNSQISKDVYYDIADRGFTNPVQEYIEIVISFIYDDSDEIVSEHREIPIATTSNYIMSFSFDIPTNFNKRISAFAIYYRDNKDNDYEQIKFVNLLKGREEDYFNFYIDSLSPNGIFLLQTIGTSFKLKDYTPLNSFQDYKYVNGIGYALKDNKIHYPIVGNGKVSENIFYEDRVLPILSNKTIIKLSNIKDVLGYSTNESLKIILVQDLELGELFFANKDGVGFGIENKKAIVETTDGIFLLTKNGIYFTDSQNEQNISIQINDIIRENYKNAGLAYDNVNKRLWLYIFGETKLYSFSFIDKAWSEHIFAIAPDEIFFDDNSNMVITKDQAIYNINSIGTGTATIESHKIDFGKSELLKYFNRYTIDFIGRIKVEEQEYINNERKKTVIERDIDDRTANESFDYLITAYDETIIYNINLDIEVTEYA